MSYVDFFAEAAVHGLILGVGAGSSPEEVEAALGSSFLDDVDKRRRSFRRDYGLIEWGFEREGGGWQVRRYALQVHRLAHDTDAVPEPLRAAYGEFPATVAYAPMADAIQALGARVAIAPGPPDPQWTRYVVSGSETSIVVLAEPSDAIGDLSIGDIWSISVFRGQ